MVIWNDLKWMYPYATWIIFSLPLPLFMFFPSWISWMCINKQNNQLHCFDIKNSNSNELLPILVTYFLYRDNAVDYPLFIVLPLHLKFVWLGNIHRQTKSLCSSNKLEVHIWDWNFEFGHDLNALAGVKYTIWQCPVEDLSKNRL